MAKFQVVTMKVREGTSKAGNAYKMLNCGGMFTGDDGVVEIGEVSFFDRPEKPVPTHLQVGHSYTPMISAVSRDGKLSFEITELKPIVVSAQAKAA